MERSGIVINIPLCFLKLKIMIINAGSENKGGTLEQATINANNWLHNIHADGFLEVEMSFIEQYKDDNFLFNFTHSITKKIATLEMHGFTEDQCKKFMFHPRVYWNGSSTGDPEISDWLADGYKYKVVYYKP